MGYSRRFSAASLQSKSTSPSRYSPSHAGHTSPGHVQLSPPRAHTVTSRPAADVSPIDLSKRSPAAGQPPREQAALAHAEAQVQSALKSALSKSITGSSKTAKSGQKCSAQAAQHGSYSPPNIYLNPKDSGGIGKKITSSSQLSKYMLPHSKVAKQIAFDTPSPPRGSPSYEQYLRQMISTSEQYKTTPTSSASRPSVPPRRRDDQVTPSETSATSSVAATTAAVVSDESSDSDVIILSSSSEEDGNDLL